MKAVKLILKISGAVLFLLGAACLIAAFFDEITAKLPGKKHPSEFDDYADVIAN